MSRLLWLFALCQVVMLAVPKIESVVYVAETGTLRVMFSEPIGKMPTAAQVTVTLKNGDKVEDPALVVQALGGGTSVLDVVLKAPLPASRANTVEIKGSEFGGTTGPFPVPDLIDAPGDLRERMKKVADTSAERSIFASGLVTTASTGSAGAGDVSLNSIDLGVPNLKTFLQLKRSTQKEGDPKNFEFGLKHTSAIAVNPKSVHSTFTAILFDIAAKSEGTATKFGIQNFVGDTAVSLQTPVFDLGPRSYAHFRIVGGMEGGSNQSKGDAPVEVHGFERLKNVDWIARSTAGIEGTLRFENNRQVLPFELIELSGGTVYRYLYFDELRYNATTDKVDSTTRGGHPWTQLDLKLYLGHTDGARYGLKLTYQRGSLPPVFAPTKAFQFGFLYETKSRTGN